MRKYIPLDPATPFTVGASPADDTGLAARVSACPWCNGYTYRIPRRFVDRLIDKFVSVHRHRCRSMGCGWQGNLRAVRRQQVIR